MSGIETENQIRRVEAAKKTAELMRRFFVHVFEGDRRIHFFGEGDELAPRSSGKVQTIRLRETCVRPGGRTASEAVEFYSQITIENENHGKNPRNGSTQ